MFTGKNNWGQISICMANNLLYQYNVCLISATRQKFKNTGDLSKVFVVCKNTTSIFPSLYTTHGFFVSMIISSPLSQTCPRNQQFFS